MTKSETQRIAELTQDAYSRPRYTKAAWLSIARQLLASGWTEAEVRWILESKHMRWAADAANRNHSATAADFDRYVTTHVGSYAKLLGTARAELAKENPNVLRNGTETRRAVTGADLAGACEGEDIADLIDLARTIRDENGTHSARAAQILDRINRRAR